MDIRTIALHLLLLRIIAVFFMSLVLKRQIKLLRSNDSPELQPVRITLFVLALIIFCGNFMPILIDTITLFANVVRGNPALIGVTYAYSNALTAATAGITFWLLYRNIEREQVALAGKVEKTRTDLKRETDKVKKKADETESNLRKDKKNLQDENKELRKNGH